MHKLLPCELLTRGQKKERLAIQATFPTNLSSSLADLSLNKCHQFFGGKATETRLVHRATGYSDAGANSLVNAGADSSVIDAGVSATRRTIDSVSMSLMLPALALVSWQVTLRWNSFVYSNYVYRTGREFDACYKLVSSWGGRSLRAIATLSASLTGMQDYVIGWDRVCTLAMMRSVVYCTEVQLHSQGCVSKLHRVSGPCSGVQCALSPSQLIMMFSCPFRSCGMSLSSRKTYLLHIKRVHSDESRYPCSISGCRKVFGSFFSMRNHVYSHHPLKESMHLFSHIEVCDVPSVYNYQRYVNKEARGQVKRTAPR